MDIGEYENRVAGFMGMDIKKLAEWAANCEVHIEALVQERDAAIEREQALARELEQERYHRRAVQESDQALAAHVEEQKEALEDITQAAQQEGMHFSGWQEQVDKAVSAMLSSPTTSLARRDLIKQAEALESSAKEIAKCHERASPYGISVAVRMRAKELRQQAADLIQQPKEI